MASPSSGQFEMGDPPPVDSPKLRDNGTNGDRPPHAETQREASFADDSAKLHPLDSFVLRSPAVVDDGVLPTEFTGDGAGISPPLEWKGAPVETKSYALIMHHLDPEGIVKWYWTLYNLPPDLQSLPQNVQNIGSVGNNSVNRQPGYAPPHSKGPGPKTYILTLYALSAEPLPEVPASQVSRQVLLTAMKGHILATAQLQVTYARPKGANERREDNPPPRPPRDSKP